MFRQLEGPKGITSRQYDFVINRNEEEKEEDKENRNESHMSQQLKLLVLGSVLWEYEFCIKFHAFGSPCEDKYVISSIASGLLWWVWLY